MRIEIQGTRFEKQGARDLRACIWRLVPQPDKSIIPEKSENRKLYERAKL